MSALPPPPAGAAQSTTPAWAEDPTAPGQDALLTQRLGKTEAGQRAITERAGALSRSARNLLLIIDARHPVGHWLDLVKGSSVAELRQLLAAGLLDTAASLQAGRVSVSVAAAAAAAALAATPASADTLPDGLPPAGPTARPAPADAPPARTSLSNALQLRGYRLLYDRITAEARPQLGLIKGYKLILEVERCTGPEAIRALALQFVEQVRAVHGTAEARALAQRLADAPAEP